jgi:signal peptidase II
MNAPSAPSPWPARLLALGSALIAATADQALKAQVVRDAAAGETLGPFGPLHVTLTGNTGISYGLLQDGGDAMRWGLAVFACAVVAALAVWAARNSRLITGLGLGLIIGGAVGNLIDRLMRGAVVDFIDARALAFPWIFNLADSAITVGICLLLLESWVTPGPPQTGA